MYDFTTMQMVFYITSPITDRPIYLFSSDILDLYPVQLRHLILIFNLECN